MPFPRSVNLIIMGIFILILALVLWRMTHSFLGWLVLFIPGTAFVMRGLLLIVRGDE
jgi:hypothetical protein